eukprot:NODE_200_length_13167_cov_0.338537.p3 type:complete len:193 gc:universal NODE_200_length_13167_cov_0.338537:7591-7013(-)
MKLLSKQVNQKRKNDSPKDPPNDSKNPHKRNKKTYTHKNHPEEKCWVWHPELHPKNRKSQVAVIDGRPQLPVGIKGNGQTNGQSTLLDSGSAENIISKSLANYLSLTISPSKWDAQSITGSKLECVGQTTATLNLRGLSPSLNVEISLMICDNTGQDLILGSKFLNHFGTKNDFEMSTIILNEFNNIRGLLY